MKIIKSKPHHSDQRPASPAPLVDEEKEMGGDDEMGSEKLLRPHQLCVDELDKKQGKKALRSAQPKILDELKAAPVGSESTASTTDPLTLIQQALTSPLCTATLGTFAIAYVIGTAYKHFGPLGAVGATGAVGGGLLHAYQNNSAFNAYCRELCPLSPEAPVTNRAIKNT